MSPEQRLKSRVRSLTNATVTRQWTVSQYFGRYLRTPMYLSLSTFSAFPSCGGCQITRGLKVWQLDPNDY